MSDYLIIFAFIALTFNIWLFLKSHSQEKHYESVINFTQKVSIIIALKNEEKNISQLVKKLIEINYSYDLLEIILIDDYSTDSTLSLLMNYKNSKFIVLKNSDNPDKKIGKKAALSYGIKNSTGDILFFTDADCLPAKEWINTFLYHFEKGADFVFGYSPFIKKDSLLNRFIRFENTKTSFLMKSFYYSGYPYMCFGRNSAYKKSLFNKLNGFNSIERSLSGDDDLFLQLALKSDSVIHFCEDENGIIKTEPVDNWNDYLRKKIRHTSAGKYYNPFISFLLSIYHFCNVISLIGIFISLFCLDFFGLILMILPSIISLLSLKKLSKGLQYSDSVFQIYTLELLSFVYYFFLFFSLFKKKIKW